ncbi:hypothetical protein [Limibacillus halophilus]|uniref:Uncharacterized protein n=1 Tax=Limibacillus halophilus TaxID=1579333 RepID=A0A839SX45_9PROT|nr:hypothetical protein [Limibacillus halophilus]MBB3066224.1 hypothetical protein [Limibacillus halophilus]
MASTVQKPFFGDTPEMLWGDPQTLSGEQAVFLQCGRGSIHHKWLSNTGRNWDLIVNYYDDSYLHSPIGDIAFYQRGTKFSGVYNVAQVFPSLLSYRHILLLDDDLLFGVEALSQLFRIAEEKDLHLFQSSLTADSYCAWPLLHHQKGERDARPVNAVEIMMPGFSGEALNLCLSDFPRSLSGWGLDFLCGERVSQHFDQAPQVIDSVQARHTKEINTEDGAYYRFVRSLGIDPAKELKAICKEFGLTPDIMAL